MRIIHCADIHLGSAMDSRLPAEKAEERRRELRATFTALTEYAKEQGVNAVIIAGDLFDCALPLKKDKEFFYNAVKNTPQTKFFYLRGNHDAAQSYTLPLPNLFTFTDAWTSYDLGGVVISGLEITRKNAGSFYSDLKLDSAKTNIVTLHGQIGAQENAGVINLSRLAGKNVDYLALGHLHGFSQGRIDARGVYAYSGCLEGRGFDEEGEKGFILIDTGAAGIRARFVPFAKRAVRVASFDISGAQDAFAACGFVNANLKFPLGDIVRVVLKGETDFDVAGLAEELQTLLMRGGRYYVEVKDLTSRKLDLSELSREVSLRGEFVRQVLAAEDVPEEDKKRVIALGLRAVESGEAGL